MKRALILLAAGQGTRMNSNLPKVLHQLGGAPLLHHALSSGAALAPERTVVVTGPEGEAVASAAQDHTPGTVTAVQHERLGTAHAVLQARKALEGFDGDVIVLYGDTPFIRPQTLERMCRAREAGKDIVVLGFDAADPARYGRLVTRGDDLDRIVEYKDATDQERAITLCNSGVIAADAKTLFDLAAAVGNSNASGEYYLTDIIAIARDRGLTATVVTCDEAETLGINSRAELAAAEALFQIGARRDMLDGGVTMIAPETVFLAHDTVIGRDVVIEPNVVFGPGVTVETGATIRAFSHIEGAHVGAGAIVGPYARLRPGAELGNDARIGNFVEIKSAAIGEGAKVNHLSYVGDATVGAGTNIGAGTITCNYDGVFKHHTTIGSGVFIGTNTALVAPVSLGDRSMTATGTVVTEDVPNGAMALSRTPQLNKPGIAEKYFDRLKRQKARQQKKDS